MKSRPIQRIGAFITPHGYGHTTRMIAVLEAMQRRCPDLVIEIFTTVSDHLFHESLNNYNLHRVIPDVGLVQYNALENDLPATIKALDMLLPFSSGLVKQLAKQVQSCSLILCDIAPLGIVVAEAAGIPSVLIENFTWDYIYQPYINTYPQLDHHARGLAKIYAGATLHIQAEPICRYVATATTCPPIFRRTRATSRKTRQELGVGDRKLILISLGGLDFKLPHWCQLDSFKDFFFVLAGQQAYKKISANCLAIPHHSPFYHPDLILAADLVVFKSGYSTMAECLQAGTRALCIARPDFQESVILAEYIKNRLGGTLLSEHDFISGSWIFKLPELLAQPRPKPAETNGAEHVADLLMEL